jgi:hypothetical protein
MAESKKIEEGAQSGAQLVQSTTSATPAEADKSSLPNAMDAKTDDPPVRSGKPDVAIAQVLTAGAGEHTPPDPKVYGPDGRRWASDEERDAWLDARKAGNV